MSPFESKVLAFLLKYNGVYVDYDHAWGYQCMDLYQQFNHEVVGAVTVPSATAAGVVTNYPKNNYVYIANGPTNFPFLGDVVIWKVSNILPLGHIGVCIAADPLHVLSFDQNWPIGHAPWLVNHNYNSPPVAGWLHPTGK